MENPIRIALIITLVLLMASCTDNSKPKPDPTKPPKFALPNEPKFVHQGNLWFLTQQNDTLQQISIELADTDAEREQGLMYRRSMEQNQGMLFIFPDESRRSFWMRETHISLDIIFINAQKQIIHIAPNCKPYSLESIPSFEYAQFVVEVNAGYCAHNKIAVGHKIGWKPVV